MECVFRGRGRGEFVVRGGGEGGGLKVIFSLLIGGEYARGGGGGGTASLKVATNCQTPAAFFSGLSAPESAPYFWEFETTAL